MSLIESVEKNTSLAERTSFQLSPWEPNSAAFESRVQGLDHPRYDLDNPRKVLSNAYEWLGKRAFELPGASFDLGAIRPYL